MVCLEIKGLAYGEKEIYSAFCDIVPTASCLSMCPAFREWGGSSFDGGAGTEDRFSGLFDLQI